MILADENIHSFIIKALREAGFEVLSVKEFSGGIKDVLFLQQLPQKK